MIHRFADFELDEDTRQLRLRGRELTLQPRVFDLLVYLVRHRHRVVGKDELLEAVWPGVIVTDGSLQRAVSLARAALRQGGCAKAVRTHSRQGYRFCLEPDIAGGEMPDAQGALAEAHRAFEEHRWEEAVAAFQAADRAAGLTGLDLERWAQASLWAGRPADGMAPLERAVPAHAAAGDRRGAARAALRLADIQLDRRETAVARGWYERAVDYLDGEAGAGEQALAQVLAARLAMFDGDMEAALRHARAARALGRDLGDADAEGLGLVYSGLALLALGQVREGVALQDQAAATALAGQVSPWVSGVIYCTVIWGCRNCGDWDRAAQWTDQFTRWCARNGLSVPSGNCRLHRAEVLSVRGRLDEAEREILQSTEQLAATAYWARGDAYRVLGDLRLARGELQAAEEAYRRAYELGWDPQPGYANLQAALGRPQVALRGLERALEAQSWINGQRRGQLLANLAVIAAMAGDGERARLALDELDEHAELWSTRSMAALMARAWAEVALLEGHVREAIDSLRQALAIWQGMGSPLNVGLLRRRLADFLIAEGDREAADMELRAAESLYEELSAPALVQSCRELRHALSERTG